MSQSKKTSASRPAERVGVRLSCVYSGVDGSLNVGELVLVDRVEAERLASLGVVVAVEGKG